MSSSTVLTEVRDGVGIVTLNRPASRNALNGELLAAIPAALSQLDNDPEVRALVLTGADPAFCAGLDLQQLGSAEGLARADLPTHEAGDGQGHDAMHRSPLPPLNKPIIGAIHGAAVTGGLELALNCDFLIASERARFADTHSRVGVMPGWGMTVLLPRYIGQAAARDMSMTGRFVHAEEALRLGLVNKVVPHEELLSATLAHAADIVANEPKAVETLLASYKATSLLDSKAAFQHEQQVSRQWRKEQFSPEEVARRREAIIKRGSSRI